MAPQHDAHLEVVSSHHDDVLRATDTNIRKLSVNIPDLADLTLEAKQATESEKNMSLKQAFRLYKKAMLFSVLFSTAIVMEGYDTALIAAFYAFPPFAEKYGTYTGEKNGYQIPAKWQVRTLLRYFSLIH